jgi:acyl transferase domain-containing protein/NAD(P)H-dependent flavin oxidoreductase YrpB (nitropropane dioxygenase family)/NADP-dependent 3-hydroxy acid dehydrogenase YdfG
MQISDLIALTPAGVAEPSLAIAACRAGARGFLDLEYTSDPDQGLRAVEGLERFTAAPFGVKIGQGGEQVLQRLAAARPARLAWVLLAGGDHEELAAWVHLFQDQGVDVLFEAVNLAEVQLGERLRVDGLVLKGQEAGGRVGAETAFILLQRYRARPTTTMPAWVQGGVGVRTAAACLAAGAAGVVVDAQLLLARESPLAEAARQRLAAIDGSETTCLGECLGESYRLFARPGLVPAEELAREEERLAASELSAPEKLEAWRQIVRKLAGADPERAVWLVGQDAALAAPLAARYTTVAGILQAVVRQAGVQLQTAARLRPLAAGSPLAERHRTRYPIVQGPMTRVSDTAPFAEAVAAAGALPFIALALLRRAEAEELLKETRAQLAGRSWGVGLLGFVPPEIRQEQLEAIRACPPPFALIAGGRPDQARALEADGIPTYLHVPSPGLLRLFLRDGARRFVFEGRECGGHVGPRTSFVLWETMAEVLLDHLGAAGRGDDLHVIFAGGIHDALSAAMVAALAAPLAERGVAVGVLMGTAYLFTREAVAGGGIVPRFQHEALACRDTVLFQTGPGHAIRCLRTPYFDVFEAEKCRLRSEGKNSEEVTQALEWMNIGRLRVASKGLDRAPEAAGGARLVALAEDEQFRRGMYMMGQVACLRDRVLSMAELHEDVCTGGTRLLEAAARPVEAAPAPRERPCDVAVIGMACFYPKAGGLWPFWENVLNRVNAVTEVPDSHWDWRLFYDPDPRARDKMISKWGGFLEDVPFDPLAFGMPPNTLPSIEPLQLLLLEAVRQALADAGYAERPFARERTCAFVGVGGGGLPLSVSYGLRTCLPLLDTVPNLGVASAELLKKSEPFLPEWTEDSFPGILLNVAAGRVANRFNLGGANYAIDAACGSSLAAVIAGVRELEAGTSDVAVAMGADAVQTPFAYVAFSKTHALSPRGRCRPFDAGADGIVLSEGIGAVILKRLADAERDGDRVYAVIKGVGASSDGRDKGLTAPRADGQLRALRRAYARDGLSPARVGLIEAHGTGTVVGDQTEAEALGQVFREAGAEAQACALGSIKSLIGHSKCAAGIAGLIKTALALHHKVLPPTLVEAPNPKANFEESPLYLNIEARPWVHGTGVPRCAGVSAFGFGGTNFHVVLEEHTNDYVGEPRAALRTWPAELLVWRRPSRDALAASVAECRQALLNGARPCLAELARALWKANGPDTTQPTLAVVASSLEDLTEKLTLALETLAAPRDSWADPRGVYFAEKPAAHGGRITFLFPGQGSQYVNMLGQVALTFREVGEVFDRAERCLAGRLEKPLSRFVFPPPAFTPAKEQQARQALTRPEVAQPAVGAAALAMCRLLNGLGVEPDLLAGHSYGEYVALCAAGALTEDELFGLSHRRGLLLAEATGRWPGGMAALDAGARAVATLLSGLDGVTIANLNAPNQTVVSGTEEALQAALARCQERGVRGQRLPVACGFHSPLVAPARTALAEALASCRFAQPRRPVYSNSTAAPYAGDPAAIAGLLVDHLISPVRFQAEVEALYEAGARVFIEVGPQGVLTGLVNQTLADRPHLAVASDQKGRPGLVQFQHLLGQLLVSGVSARLDRLYQGRDLRAIDLGNLDRETGAPRLPPSTWLVNGIRSRPLNGREPLLLGRTKHLNTPPAPPAPAPTPAPAPPVPVLAAAIGANGVGPPVLTAAAGAGDDAAQVVLRFQELMARFLDTQNAVMTAYLQGSDAAPPAGPLTVPPAVIPNGHSATAAPAAPAPEVPAAPPAPVAATPAFDRAWLSTQLMDLVSKRTGYPKEMLRPDLDLEGDLGIDSIKRVEILGGLAEVVGGGNGSLPATIEMEKLTTLKTLRGILDYLGGALAKPEAKAAPSAPTNGVVPPDGKPLAVQRALVRLVDAPLPVRPAILLPSGTLLLTDDGRGVARELAGRLADFGQKTALVRFGSPDQDGPDLFHADLTDPRAVDDLLQRARRQAGPLAGLIHLLPLAEPPAGEGEVARMRREVKSLYLLARGLGEDLRASADKGGAVLLAGTALGGSLGFGGQPLPDSYFAGHGGILGFVKCLAFEWPEVLVRAVDLDVRRPPFQLAERLLGEFGDREGPLEVGYLDARRVTWEPVAAPLAPDHQAEPLLGSDSTVLVTGGARGITAAVALELAKRYRPNLVVVGRSPLPEDKESPDTAPLKAPAEIKAALMGRLQREGRPVVAATVEAAYQRLLRDREIRANLARLREAGGRVHYFPVDIRDGQALGDLLDDLDRRFGGVDGVLHGAGVIEDKLVRDKTPESFDRVFGTKVESAVALSKRLRPERLKFCVFFASIASRYGNKGQADYAAANEVLSKLAIALDRRWPCRVFSVAWGPWSQVGMVADLEKHLTRRGLRLISPEEGPAFLLDELLHGKKGDSEVIIAGGTEHAARPARGGPLPSAEVGRDLAGATC